MEASGDIEEQQVQEGWEGSSPGYGGEVSFGRDKLSTFPWERNEEKFK